MAELYLQPSLSEVADFSDFYRKHKLRDCQKKMTLTLESNRRTVSRLFTSGAVFTLRGTEVGQGLLMVHRQILEIVELFDGQTSESRIDALFEKLEATFLQHDELSAQANQTIAQLPNQ